MNHLKSFNMDKALIALKDIGDADKELTKDFITKPKVGWPISLSYSKTGGGI